MKAWTSRTIGISSVGWTAWATQHISSEGAVRIQHQVVLLRSVCSHHHFAAPHCRPAWLGGSSRKHNGQSDPSCSGSFTLTRRIAGPHVQLDSHDTCKLIFGRDSWAHMRLPTLCLAAVSLFEQHVCTVMWLLGIYIGTLVSSDQQCSPALEQVCCSKARHR